MTQIPQNTPSSAKLRTDAVSIGYDRTVISSDLSVEIPEGSFTVIVGPNACGKSTLLRSLARLITPSEGTVLLDGADISKLGTKELARRLGLLPQTSIAPDGIRVADLVARGRYPHQGLFTRWSEADERAVAGALAATKTTELSERLVEELSGGQRQRVWVAMVLAQDTGALLLDEPTTYLDIAHQIDVLELFRELNEGGQTLVAVLHDLNHAARYATHVIAMKDGAVRASGTPAEVITEELVEDVFSLPCRVITDPVTGSPLVIPLGRAAVVEAPAEAATSGSTTGSGIAA
ncbi:ABC transporter ATP-binding protein [Mycetocola tolaasinivorans]|uniref:ABC transporter ATP-binding protein n=1 Tax=Mycetocola tolaasinivorans TaxID=76635 RepID=A0A3L7A9M9_9MICO|nr:ABC transporter ATP-binding protein [Mycetocola tolaasinivorans]RLP76794.1 ABC transporter ATP-binding protein [Mycetocola tolaasinivorans]